MTQPLRVLLLADSHIGFDLPVRPRIDRRRRGHDFLANHVAALAAVGAGGVDLVVHGGDVFHRARVPASLAYQAYAPLLRVADQGVPVFVVPGNHERSRLPHRRLLTHPRVHVFDAPRTFVVEVAGRRVALAGFPYQRGGVRARFRELVEATSWARCDADIRFLCLHHCVEGARVGPGDHVFDHALDVIRGRDIPAGFAAVLSGHIHRHQVLTMDLSGRPLAAPVLYPGSVERTSTAEAGEPKGFLAVTVGESRSGSPPPGLDWELHRLPARPMLVRELAAGGMDGRALEAAVRRCVDAAPADAVLCIRLAGEPSAGAADALTAARLRALAPATMNLEVRMAIDLLPLRGTRRAGRRTRRLPAGDDVNLQLGL